MELLDDDDDDDDDECMEGIEVGSKALHPKFIRLHEQLTFAKVRIIAYALPSPFRGPPLTEIPRRISDCFRHIRTS